MRTRRMIAAVLLMCCVVCGLGVGYAGTIEDAYQALRAQNAALVEAAAIQAEYMRLKEQNEALMAIQIPSA